MEVAETPDVTPRKKGSDTGLRLGETKRLHSRLTRVILRDREAIRYSSSCCS